MTTSDLQLLKALILTAPFASLADPALLTALNTPNVRYWPSWIEFNELKLFSVFGFPGGQLLLSSLYATDRPRSLDPIHIGNSKILKWLAATGVDPGTDSAKLNLAAGYLRNWLTWQLQQQQAQVPPGNLDAAKLGILFNLGSYFVTPALAAGITNLNPFVQADLVAARALP